MDVREARGDRKLRDEERRLGVWPHSGEEVTREVDGEEEGREELDSLGPRPEGGGDAIPPFGGRRRKYALCLT